MPDLIAALAAAVLAASASAAPTYTVERIPGPDGGWDLAAVDAAAHRLYVARTDAVMAVDLVTRQVTPALVPLHHGHGVLVVPGTGRVIATSGDSNEATLFDGASGHVIAVLPTAKKPDAVAWDPATRTVWVMDPGAGAATVIDPMAAKVLATVEIGGSLELGVADGKGRLFINVEDKNEVVVVDTKARKVLRRFPLAGCDGPTGIAYAASANRIVSACANGVVKVSAPDGHDLGTVKIGLRPDGAAFDAERGLALVPSAMDGQLSLIRVDKTPEKVGSVATQPGARTIAFDPASGTAYLPSAEYRLVPNARPQPVPGTFSVLVVKPAGAGG